MTSKRDRMIQRMMDRQNNTRGMGLARDVRAGQAKPVPSQALKKAMREARARYEWQQGRRNA